MFVRKDIGDFLRNLPPSRDMRQAGIPILAEFDTPYGTESDHISFWLHGKMLPEWRLKIEAYSPQQWSARGAAPNEQAFRLAASFLL
jgi:hypothetical protein